MSAWRSSHQFLLESEQCRTGTQAATFIIGHTQQRELISASWLSFHQALGIMAVDAPTRLIGYYLP